MLYQTDACMLRLFTHAADDWLRSRRELPTDQSPPVWSLSFQAAILLVMLLCRQSQLLDLRFYMIWKVVDRAHGRINHLHC